MWTDDEILEFVIASDMKLIKPEDRWDYYEEINRRREKNV